MEKEINILLIILLVVVIIFLASQIIMMYQGALVSGGMNTMAPSGSRPQSATDQVAPITDTTAGWLTYNDGKNGVSFKYPAVFGANVWRPTQWPPLVTVATSGQDFLAKGCPNLQGSNGGAPVPTQGKTAAGLTYNLYLGSDIGAGQLYSEYCYVITLPQSGSAAVIDFVIQSHSACGFGTCGAYCGTQYEAECLTLNRQQAIEAPIKQMVSSFIFAPPAPAQTQTPPAVAKVVTLADNQTNILLNAGDTFLLQLGGIYNWTITAVDPAVVSRVSVSAPGGSQGVYRANKIGGTDLTAVGDPVCRSVTPPCAIASISFNAHIMVR